jgi:hypothetical protein
MKIVLLLLLIALVNAGWITINFDKIEKKAHFVNMNAADVKLVRKAAEMDAVKKPPVKSPVKSPVKVRFIYIIITMIIINIINIITIIHIITIINITINININIKGTCQIACQIACQGKIHKILLYITIQ